MSGEAYCLRKPTNTHGFYLNIREFTAGVNVCLIVCTTAYDSGATELGRECPGGDVPR
jgi:hypothetical protein